MYMECKYCYCGTADKTRIITITKPSNYYINSELSAIKICQSLALNTFTFHVK